MPTRAAMQGGVAERLCSGLQIRLGRFDSDPRLQTARRRRSSHSSMPHQRASPGSVFVRDEHRSVRFAQRLRRIDRAGDHSWSSARRSPTHLDRIVQARVVCARRKSRCTAVRTRAHHSFTCRCMIAVTSNRVIRTTRPIARLEDQPVLPEWWNGRHKGLEQLSPRGETPEVKPVKVGEDPGLSPNWPS